MGGEIICAVFQNWYRLALLSAIAAAAIFAALTLHYVVFRILKGLARRTEIKIYQSVAKYFGPPARWIMVLIAIALVLPLFGIPDRLTGFCVHISSLILIFLVAWLLIKSTYVLDDYVLDRFSIDMKDNLRARKIHTQLRVLKRIVTVVVFILALSTALMTFDKVRQLGTTILASAGIIGIVVGMAAQKTIGTFIAGLQIAFSQPIRIDDVVIVENEWGRIEEITLTYVVVKIWDLRRLVVPITYFIERPFQNWTRTSADILGTVYIYVDYTVPVDKVRQELKAILDASEDWDRKVCVLQVTNTSERTIELRALMSAADASKAWNLRCLVREKLVEFIRSSYPAALPRLRAELEKVDNL